jgi:exodeoxyribonuclease VII small subunit
MPDTSIPDPPSFESALARIEAIVHELEEGQTGLAESLGRYEEAVGLLKQCYGLLEKAERRIELLVGTDAAGNPVTEPFDDTASTERDQQASPRSRRRSSAAPKPAPPAPTAPPTPAADNSDVESAGELF